MDVLLLLALSGLIVAAIEAVRGTARRTARTRAAEDGLVRALVAPPRAEGEFLMADAVREALGLLDGRAARQGVRFQTAVADGLALRGDAGAMRRMLVAMCAHAAAAAPAGQVVVTACRRGGQVRIVVADDGAGAAAGEFYDAARGGAAGLRGVVWAERFASGGMLTAEVPADDVLRPWNATIRNAMEGFDRVAASVAAAPALPVAQPA